MPHLILLCLLGDSDIFDVPANDGFGQDEIVNLLGLLRDGDYTFEVVDKLSEEERQDLYFKAAATTALTKHGVRQPFGSNRAGGGPFFGKQVPALLALDEEGSILDVYPHKRREGGLQTIRAFLGALDAKQAVPLG
jgi:hypothetical protein